MAKNKPQTLRIGNVTLGGRSGEHACVMVGSIFHAGHRIVRDESKGEFDRCRARELIEKQAEMSSLTGLPCMLDVIAGTTESMIKYLEFMAETTNLPLLVDSMSPQVRMDAIKYFAKSEVIDRLVYNSIDDNYTLEELETISIVGIKSAVVMAFNNTAIKPMGKISLLENKLLPGASKAGVENILVDCGVLDIASVGWSAAAMKEVKFAMGYPVGCAPSNALYSWKRKKGLAKTAFEAVGGAIFSYLMSNEANFLFYGPIGSEYWVFPACAAADAVRSYAARLEGIRTQSADHPLIRFI